MPQTINGSERRLLFCMISKYQEKQQEKEAEFLQKQDCLHNVVDFLSLLKAVIGLVNRSVGQFGLNKIVQLPRPITRYYERSLTDCPVVYDGEGWPVHPLTRRRTVRCIGLYMEFVLNVMFFVILPCVMFCEFTKEIYNRCIKLDGNKWMPKSDMEQKIYSSHDIQSKSLETSSRRRRHHRRLKRWMTEEAQDLASKVMLGGLEKKTALQPLLHEEFCRCGNRVLHHSCLDAADSEGDETEYVLMQIQKSKESLAKNQRKLCAEK